MNKSFIHPSASIDPSVTLGDGCSIWQGCILLGGAQVGARCKLGHNVMVEGGVTIGAGVTIKDNVVLYSGVTLGDDVFVGPNVVFTNVMLPRAFISRKQEFLPTVVGNGASLGANATLVCGNSIGGYAMIAAGTVVTKDVPAFALWAGNPGKQIGWVSRHGCVLKDDLLCPDTGEAYSLVNGSLRPVE